ncbi:hypothetical protein ACFL20_11130 [Spirochaetota bacterium]
MIFKKTYKFKDIESWDDELHESAEQFAGLFGVYPNIIISNANTYLLIDIEANKNRENIQWYGIAPPPDNDFKCLGSFAYSPKYEIDFCADNSLQDKQFVLIHDPAPDDPDGGEPIPELDSDFVMKLLVAKKASQL